MKFNPMEKLPDQKKDIKDPKTLEEIKRNLIPKLEEHIEKAEDRLGYLDTMSKKDRYKREELEIDIPKQEELLENLKSDDL